MGSCGASVSNCGLPMERGSASVSNENAPSETGGAFCVWLPGLVSQSVILWDMVGLEMVLGPKRHLSLSLSLEPLR